MKPGDIVLYKFYSTRELVLILSQYNLGYYQVFSLIDNSVYIVMSDKLFMLSYICNPVI